MVPSEYFTFIEPGDMGSSALLLPKEIKAISYLTFLTPVYFDARFKTWRVFIILLEGKVTKHKIESFVKIFFNNLKTIITELEVKLEPQEFINHETFIFIGESVKINPKIPKTLGRFKRLYALNSDNVVPKLCRILSNGIQAIIEQLKTKIVYTDEDQMALFDAYDRFSHLLNEIAMRHSHESNKQPTYQKEFREREESRERLMEKINAIQEAAIVRQISQA